MNTPPSHPTLNRESKMLRALLLAGCVAIGIIWVLEARSGDLAPWDRRGYPALMVTLGACAGVLTWWPQRADWARVAAVLAFNAYLLSTLNGALFSSPTTEPDPYQLLTTLFWLPMGYGTAFVFLGLRAALAFSAVLYLASTGVVLGHLAAGDMPHWPGYLKPMMQNLAIAQVIYVFVLLAIARLRADFYRSEATVEVMHQVASTDPLTGLLNRRAIADHLAANHALVRRGVHPMSVILIDVDHFKQINDRAGHAAGDEVLVTLSSLLGAQLRGSDRLARWGGEEFLLLVPATGLHAAHELAERIRQAAAAAPWRHGLAVTLSLGVAECRPDDSVDSLIGRADRALYAAKAAGRDRVCDESPADGEAHQPQRVVGVISM
ncbi:GGDEF domain-containing protein [Ideonella sp.]|uniref:GGDEF domain-containing protein n=1 Tax=Ideonella sp. TaxID=1929293 RepID=UPI0035AF5B4A